MGGAGWQGRARGSGAERCTGAECPQRLCANLHKPSAHPPAPLVQLKMRTSSMTHTPHLSSLATPFWARSRMRPADKKAG